ncbi:MAG TPA: hypothetical protein VFW11_20120 [Cyclobacteriaceae bacterium]|nr:hypothetical protein [Cyclobacteriaceae bacterium]
MFLFYISPSLAQDIYVKAVAGNYQMENLKKLQREFEATLLSNDIPVSVVSSFPISLQGEFGIDGTLRDGLLLGGFANYAVTEGRVSYSDYSGSVAIVQDLKRVLVGARILYDIGDNFNLYGKVGLNWTRLVIQTETALVGLGTSKEQAADVQSFGVAIEPGIQWSKKFNRIKFEANAGYEGNISGKLKNDDGAYLIDNNGGPITANWSGFRIGIGLCFSL